MAAKRGNNDKAPILVRDERAVSKIRRWNRKRFPRLSLSQTVGEIVEQWEQLERKAGK